MCQFIANLFKRERSTTKASPHPPSALCRPVPPLVHLDCVLQVPPFQPHQPPQKKSNPVQRNQIFWLQLLMLRLVPFCFKTHPAFGLHPPVHLDCFLTASPFQPHKALQMKTQPGRINPKLWLQPLMLPLICFCFHHHLALDLLHVFQLDFFLSVHYLK